MEEKKGTLAGPPRLKERLLDATQVCVLKEEGEGTGAGDKIRRS